MSAYILPPDHYRVLGLFAASRDSHGWQNVDVDGVEGARQGPDCYTVTDFATYYANVLYHENVRSVAFRYPGGRDKFDDLPGSQGLHSIDVKGDELRPGFSVVWLLKMLDSLEYQSCETPDYQSTVAYRLLQRTRRAAIVNLPGYDAAPWTFDRAENLAPACPQA